MMAQARLNFVDHPDHTFSSQTVWIGEYDPASPAHQNAQILSRYLDVIRGVIPEDADEIAEASRPVLDTGGFIQLTDENGGCRLQMGGKPKADSPSYIARMKALRFFEFLNQAASDALVTREDGLAVVVGKETINQRNHNL